MKNWAVIKVVDYGYGIRKQTVIGYYNSYDEALKIASIHQIVDKDEENDVVYMVAL